MTNGQQLIDNIKNYVSAIVDITCAQEDDEVKSEFINICTRKYLGTYINFSDIDDLIIEAKMIVQSRKNLTDDSDSGDEYGNY